VVALPDELLLLLPLPPPPQPKDATRHTTKRTIIAVIFSRFFRENIPKIPATASAASQQASHPVLFRSFCGAKKALLAGVVFTVMLLAAGEPERLICAALNEHVGGSFAAPCPL
jgi:hypothetical protein